MLAGEAPARPLPAVAHDQAFDPTVIGQSAKRLYLDTKYSSEVIDVYNESISKIITDFRFNIIADMIQFKCSFFGYVAFYALKKVRFLIFYY